MLEVLFVGFFVHIICYLFAFVFSATIHLFTLPHFAAVLVEPIQRTHKHRERSFYLLIYLHSLIMPCKSYKTLRLRFGDSWWRSRATFYALVYKRKQFELFFDTVPHAHIGTQKGEKLTTLFTWTLVLLPHTHVSKSINLLFIHRFHQGFSFAFESIYFMVSMWQL